MLISRCLMFCLVNNKKRQAGKTLVVCKALKLTRQGFHEYLKNRNKPWKHEELAAKMI